MMLSVPVYQPFTSFKASVNDLSSILPSGKDGSRRARPCCSDTCYRIAAGRCSGNSIQSRRSLAVFSSAKEAADGLPVKEVGNLCSLAVVSCATQGGYLV